MYLLYGSKKVNEKTNKTLISRLNNKKTFSKSFLFEICLKNKIFGLVNNKLKKYLMQFYNLR